MRREASCPTPRRPWASGRPCASRAPARLALRLPRPDPGLLTARLQPPLLVPDHLQPLDQRRELAVLEHVIRTGPWMALEVRAGGMGHDEPATPPEPPPQNRPKQPA